MMFEKLNSGKTKIRDYCCQEKIVRESPAETTLLNKKITDKTPFYKGLLVCVFLLSKTVSLTLDRVLVLNPSSLQSSRCNKPDGLHEV